MVRDGGLAACGINYVVLGKETADMAVEILNGKKEKLFLRHYLMRSLIYPVGHRTIEQVERVDLHINEILETKCLKLVFAIHIKGDHNVQEQGVR